MMVNAPTASEPSLLMKQWRYGATGRTTQWLHFKANFVLKRDLQYKGGNEHATVLYLTLASSECAKSEARREAIRGWRCWPLDLLFFAYNAPFDDAFVVVWPGHIDECNSN